MNISFSPYDFTVWIKLYENDYLPYDKPLAPLWSIYF